MPLALNVIYAAALVIFAPLLDLSVGSGRASIAKVGVRSSGATPPADRRPALPLVPRGERGRGPAAPAARPRDGPPPARLGDRRSRPRRPRGWPWPAGPIRTWSPSTPRWISVGPRDGPWRGPPDGPGPGRAGALAQPDPGGQAGRGQGGDHQRAGSAREAIAAIGSSADPARDRPSAGSTPWRPRMPSTPSGSSSWASPRIASSVTGSVKYDGLESDRNNPKTLRSAGCSGLSPTDLVFVAGSTMEGEEAAALAAYRAARRQHPGLRLIVVPRHAERFDRVAALAGAAGRDRPPPQPADRAAVDRVEPAAGPPVILIDTIGELAAVWGLADVAFVGGSLRPGRGGQNMMEPAAYRGLGDVRPAHRQLPRHGRPAAPPRRRPAGRRRRRTGRGLLDDLDDPRPPPPAARPAATSSWPRTAPRAGPSPSSTAWSNRRLAGSRPLDQLPCLFSTKSLK